MEQDGYILRCAHVSAWICHYSAVLKGLVARRPTASFIEGPQFEGRVGRPYPSEGVYVGGLINMLGNVDLPPEVCSIDSLAEARKLTWADSSELEEEVESAERALKLSARKRGSVSRDRARRRLDRMWIRDNLSSTVCRYLNSGIPSILCRQAMGHTQVVVGYVRADDLAVDIKARRRKSSTHIEVRSFIVSDDTMDPYCVIDVDDIVNEISPEVGVAPTVMLIPLPRGLWLTGEVAERSAIDWMQSFAKARLVALDDWEAIDSERVEIHREALTEFAAATSKSGMNRLTVRSYAMYGADFKESVADRFALEPIFVRRVGQMQLPKYVWVTEAIDRKLRGEDKLEAVRSTVVIDATTIVSSRNAPPSTILPLLAHIPGQAFTASPTQISDENDMATGWFECRLTPYRTGRWHHQYTKHMSAERVASRAKGASFGL
jgi:hypothetical protein